VGVELLPEDVAAAEAAADVGVGAVQGQGFVGVGPARAGDAAPERQVLCCGHGGIKGLGQSIVRGVRTSGPGVGRGASIVSAASATVQNGAGVRRTSGEHFVSLARRVGVEPDHAAQEFGRGGN
jgi:hypothetical protein